MHATRSINRFVSGLIVAVVVFLSTGCATLEAFYVPYDRPYLGQGYGFEPYRRDHRVLADSEVYVWGGGRSVDGAVGGRSRYSLPQLRPQLTMAMEKFGRFCEMGVSREGRWPRWHCQTLANEIAYLKGEIVREERAVGPQCTYTKEQGVVESSCRETAYGPWR